MSARGTGSATVDVEFLEQLLDDSMLRVFGGEDLAGNKIEPEKGVAGIQARRLVLDLKSQLDAARKELGETGNEFGSLSPEARHAELRAAAVELLDPDLEVYVRVYLERHELRLVDARPGQGPPEPGAS